MGTPPLPKQGPLKTGEASKEAPKETTAKEQAQAVLDTVMDHSRQIMKSLMAQEYEGLSEVAKLEIYKTVMYVNQRLQSTAQIGAQKSARPPFQPREPKPVMKISEKQTDFAKRLAEQKKVDLIPLIKEKYNKNNLDELTMPEAGNLITHLQGLK